MKQRNRLIPIREDNKLIGIVTFFVGNGEIDKYVRENSWTVVDDDSNGDTIYIDHLVGTKGKSYSKYSLEVWHYLKTYWKKRFKNITKIRWNRYKNNVVKTYTKEV